MVDKLIIKINSYLSLKKGGEENDDIPRLQATPEAARDKLQNYA